MAKQRLENTRSIPGTRLLLLAAILVGLGACQIWAGQEPATGALQGIRNNLAPQTKPSTPPAQTTPAPAPPPPAVGAIRPGQKTTVAPAPRGKALATSPRKGEKPKGGKSPAGPAQTASGKRDPFKLPPPPGKETAEGIPGSAMGALPPGTRGLIVSQLRLEVVVRENTTNKMIAVVTNERKLAYFLHENEPVYNGVVSKITPDSVYFKENVLDPSGRVTTREVVRKLGSAPGEGR